MGLLESNRAYGCMTQAHRFFLITGCSGGGKSALLRALTAQGHNTIEEPGRRILAEERSKGGHALPWGDAAAFARRAVSMAQADLKLASKMRGPVFFDRGLVDAAVALHHAVGTPYRQTLADEKHYAGRVFLAPPWPEVFVQDADRRHDIQAATEEYTRIAAALDDLGYALCVLPKVSVIERAGFVLANLNKV